MVKYSEIYQNFLFKKKIIIFHHFDSFVYMRVEKQIKKNFNQPHIFFFVSLFKVKSSLGVIDLILGVVFFGVVCAFNSITINFELKTHLKKI